jgi:hypothetical protein
VKFYVELVNIPHSDMMLSIIELFLQLRALPDCGNSGEKKCEITRICQTREVSTSRALSLFLQSAAVRRVAPDMSVYGTVSIVFMVAVCSYQSAVRAGDTNHGECSSNILRKPVSSASTSPHSMQLSSSWEWIGLYSKKYNNICLVDVIITVS